MSNLTHSQLESRIVSIAASLVKAGLYIEDHIRTSDNLLALSRPAVEALDLSDRADFQAIVVGNALSVAGFGLDRRPFIHPLCERFEIDTPNLPPYVFVSALLSEAMGWGADSSYQANIPPFPESRVNAMGLIADLLIVQGRTKEEIRMDLFKVRYSDQKLLEVSSLLAIGYESTFFKHC